MDLDKNQATDAMNAVAEAPVSSSDAVADAAPAAEPSAPEPASDSKAATQVRPREMAAATETRARARVVETAPSVQPDEPTGSEVAAEPVADDQDNEDSSLLQDADQSANEM